MPFVFDEIDKKEKLSLKGKKWRDNNKEYCKNYGKEYRADESNKKHKHEYDVEYRKNNADSEKVRISKWKEDNKEKIKITNQNRYKTRKLMVMNIISQNTLSCICCGDTNIECLEILNIKPFNSRSKVQLAKLFRQICEDEISPDDYQLYCCNCKTSRSHGSKCTLNHS